jgi:hypothetical protein
MTGKLVVAVAAASLAAIRPSAAADTEAVKELAPTRTLTYDSLPPFAEAVAGLAHSRRRLPDHRAIAVHKDRPAALAAVAAFINGAKRDGTLRRIFDAAGLTTLRVAP